MPCEAYLPMSKSSQGMPYEYLSLVGTFCIHRRCTEWVMSPQDLHSYTHLGPIKIRHENQIRPHKGTAGRSLAPALHSKAGLKICSPSLEEYLLTWPAWCDRTHNNSFLITIGANGVVGLLIDIKALTFKIQIRLICSGWSSGTNKSFGKIL